MSEEPDKYATNKGHPSEISLAWVYWASCKIPTLQAKVDRLCSRGIEDMRHRIKELEAELATERKEHIEDEAVYVACIAENAALVEAAREYSYNEHFPGCKIHRPSIKVCTCGYAELSALLQSEGEI